MEVPASAALFRRAPKIRQMRFSRAGRDFQVYASQGRIFRISPPHRRGDGRTEKSPAAVRHAPRVRGDGVERGLAEARRDEKVLVFLCLISGVIFLSAVFYLTSRTSEFKKNGIETQAEIVLIAKDYDTDGEEKITVYAKYTVENTTYTRKLDYYSFTLHEGDIITILYLPEDPSEITYPNSIQSRKLYFLSAGVYVLRRVWRILLQSLSINPSAIN